MCVHPYIATRKDGVLVPVPCGKCMECLRDYQNDWAFRLTQECRRVPCPIKVELTFAPEFVPVAYNDEVGEWQTVISKRDVQLFLKRLRKMCPEFKNNLRYYAIGEYGKDGNRCHYHIILISDAILKPYQYYKRILSAWGKGFIYIKRCEQTQIGYVTKYLNKLDESPHIVKPFRLMSKHFGLCYLSDRMLDYFFSTFATSVPWKKGYIKLPRYYRKKLDEWSNRNYGLKCSGLTFSDVVRFQKFEPKGIQVYFDDFCKNYLDHYRNIVKIETCKCIQGGYSLPDFEKLSPNAVFQYFVQSVREISLLIDESNRMKKQIQVRHGKTRVYPQDMRKVWNSS